MTLTELVRLSLEEDIGNGDVTTRATVDATQRGRARVVAKQELAVCGHEAATEVFRQLGETWEPRTVDGEWVATGTVIGEVVGHAAALLQGERVALNFLMRLSGIATHTRSAVSACPGLRVLDTRKTTPLHRALERHAVRCGGGNSHRFGLFDGVLIKDNHIVAAGGVAIAIRRARAAAHHLLRVECEVETLDELREAIEAGADAILLDNMNDATLTEAVRVTAGRAMLEASGNMTRERLATIGATGVDCVSMGGLIHQARWADLSLRITLES